MTITCVRLKFIERQFLSVSFFYINGTQEVIRIEMFTYRSNEAKKINIPMKNLDLNKMTNKEIVGLFFIGAISYQELLTTLGLSEKEGMEFIEGMSKELNLHILRDDEEAQKESW